MKKKKTITPKRPNKNGEIERDGKNGIKKSNKYFRAVKINGKNYFKYGRYIVSRMRHNNSENQFLNN